MRIVFEKLKLFGIYQCSNLIYSSTANVRIVRILDVYNDQSV